MKKIYRSKVSKGKQNGRKIGFPTVNLDPNVLDPTTKKGVYAAEVKYSGRSFLGAAYYGPRLVNKETIDVLEIYIIDFSEEIYEQEVEFSLEFFTRGVLDFPDFETLKTTLNKDIVEVKRSILQDVVNIAVVGFSSNHEKFGSKVFYALRKVENINVYPVNPKYKSFDGIEVYPSIDEIDKLDLVVFVTPPITTLKVLNDCRSKQFSKVWFQPGSESDEAKYYCQENNLTYVSEACIVIDGYQTSF